MMNEGSKPEYPTYTAVALQPMAYGCTNKNDVQKNLKNQIELIDNAFINSYLVGGGAVKLVALAEGSFQGFYDELNHMDHATYCRDIAIRIPGEETAQLARKAKEYDIYIAAQAKVVDPDVTEDRFMNQGFLISPKGEIILKHTKNMIGVVTGTASPMTYRKNGLKSTEVHWKHSIRWQKRILEISVFQYVLKHFFLNHFVPWR